MKNKKMKTGIRNGVYSLWIEGEPTKSKLQQYWGSNKGREYHKELKEIGGYCSNPACKDCN